ncbi:MAG: hypothetical protein MJY55_06680 [Bacteroidales bacterium]|nr:hypothetical protein [Bacteroidales bacterium]
MKRLSLIILTCIPFFACNPTPLEPRDIDAALWDGEKIDSLLQSYTNVRAVFSGHHHSGAHHRSGKIMHYTFRGMIEGEGNHYGIVRIYKDSIDVTEYPQKAVTSEF